MPPQDAAAGCPHESGAFYIVDLPQSGVGTTGHPGKAGNEHQPQGEDDVPGLAGAQQADDHQCQQNTGKCRQHIAKAHQHIVHNAAEIAGNGAQHRAAHRAHGHSTQRDPVGGPGALQHPAENIPAKAVRSHQVSQRRPRQLRPRCHGVGVIGRPEKAENDQSRQDAGHHQSHCQVRISLFHLPIPPIRGSMQRLTRSANVPESTTQKARITTMASTTG